MRAGGGNAGFMIGYPSRWRHSSTNSVQGTLSKVQRPEEIRPSVELINNIRGIAGFLDQISKMKTQLKESSSTNSIHCPQENRAHRSELVNNIGGLPGFRIRIQDEETTQRTQSNELRSQRPEEIRPSYETDEQRWQGCRVSTHTTPISRARSHPSCPHKPFHIYLNDAGFITPVLAPKPSTKPHYHSLWSSPTGPDTCPIAVLAWFGSLIQTFSPWKPGKNLGFTAVLPSNTFYGQV